MEIIFLPRTFHAIDQTISYRIRSVWNTINPQLDLKYPAQLQAISEITLSTQESHQVDMHPDNLMVILPLVGELSLNNKNLIEVLLPGQILTLTSNYLPGIKLSNPSATEPSLFLKTVFNCQMNQFYPLYHTVDIDQPIQQMHKIPILDGISMALGKFSGRYDYTMAIEKNHTVITYPISGAFEIEHRLMEAGDVMKLSDLDKETLELESLAKESILLMIQWKQKV